MSISGNACPLLPAGVRAGLILAALLLPAGCSNSPRKPQNPQLLPECNWLPGCVIRQSGRGAQASKPIRADAEQWQILKSWISLLEDWEITMYDGNVMQEIVTTPLLKFQDDVQWLFLPDDELIQVRSSSQLDLSDLGTNAKRLATLRKQIKP